MFLSSFETDSLAGKRVLITGASGFLGYHTVQRLLRTGAQVCAVSRTAGRLAAVERCDLLDHALCDLTNSEDTHRVFTDFKPQIVFHFASHPDGRESYSQARSNIECNLIGTLNMLESFHGTGKDPNAVFVYADSCKVYGGNAVPYRADMALMPLSSYAISKASGWELCQLYRRIHGTTTVSVRPTLIYGPDQSYNLIRFVVNCVLNGHHEVRLDGGEQTRDPLYVDDAIDAFILVAERGKSLSGRVVNIGGNNELSVKELAELIVRLMGSSIPVVCSPQCARPTDTARSFCDNDEASRAIGWQPRTNLVTGLLKTIKSIVDASGNSIPPVSLSGADALNGLEAAARVK